MAGDLIGLPIPSIAFASTSGETINVADPALGNFVLFVFPRIGRPDEPAQEDWALIPGAKGCTAESCEFRDLAADFARMGLSIYGLSTQETAHQREAVARLHLPYPLLSDPDRTLGRALGIPTFDYQGKDLYTRTTLVVREGIIAVAEFGITDAAAHPRALLAALQ